jgi:hypothetical protein
MQRCTSRNGRHDFMTQGMSVGPNAFVDCSSELASAQSENHQKWAMGTLFDNVRVTGAGGADLRQWAGADLVHHRRRGQEVRRGEG